MIDKRKPNKLEDYKMKMIEREELNKLNEYNPFGRNGNGAPIKDYNGNIVTTRRTIADGKIYHNDENIIDNNKAVSSNFTMNQINTPYLNTVNSYRQSPHQNIPLVAQYPNYVNPNYVMPNNNYNNFSLGTNPTNIPIQNGGNRLNIPYASNNNIQEHNPYDRPDARMTSAYNRTYSYDPSFQNQQLLNRPSPNIFTDRKTIEQRSSPFQPSPYPNEFTRLTTFNLNEINNRNIPSFPDHQNIQIDNPFNNKHNNDINNNRLASANVSINKPTHFNSNSIRNKDNTEQNGSFFPSENTKRNNDVISYKHELEKQVKEKQFRKELERRQQIELDEKEQRDYKYYLYFMK